LKITFLMPHYPVRPTGGFRVVYEYSNRLVSRGHSVTIVHARQSSGTPSSVGSRSLWDRANNARGWLRNRLVRPKVNWHRIDKRVEMRFAPTSDEKYIPDGDIIFATAWQTVRPVLEYSRDKGEKCYLIQHYETWMGEKELVDATWRSSLHKIVVSKWLCDVGKDLGSDGLTHISNGIDLNHYRLIQPIARNRRVAMMFSKVPFKGTADGIKALEIARAKHPDLKAIFFGSSIFRRGIPSWVEYHSNPPQDFIVNEIYNNSSIFLCPSVSEGFALPPAEAAACGCAVVSTDCGGVRDFIENGVTGLLSAPQDPEALAANLCLLLENESLRVKLATAANRSISRLDWERSTDLMEQFFKRVASSGVLKGEHSAAK
jgi:glycosyltransferase involved in cell wall biosynthesis